MAPKAKGASGSGGGKQPSLSGGGKQPSLSTFFFKGAAERRGFGNQGNTCYMSASLSALFASPVMAAALAPGQPDRPGRPPIITALAGLAADFAARYAGEATGAMDVSSLKRAVDAASSAFAGYEQQDAQEFTSSLLDSLAEEGRTCSSAANGSAEDVLRGRLSHRLRCCACGHSWCREEDFLSLTLRPDGSRTSGVDELLCSLLEVETLQCRCAAAGCGHEVVTSSPSVSRRPRVLLLHVERSCWRGAAGGHGVKSAAAVRVLPCLNFGVADSESPPKRQRRASGSGGTESDSEGPIKYRLCSVVSHLGEEASQGHYVADCHFGGGHWMRFDDSVVQPLAEEKVLHDARTKGYLLWYEADE